MATPEVPPNPVHLGGWPTWLRRTLTALVLVVAAGAMVWAVQTSGGDQKDPTGGGAVVALSPIDGAQALRQTAVGADLAQGYDGRLTINGIEIPEEQMDGAIDPSTVTAAELEQYGIRPNNRNRVYFKPGPGKVIEEFDQGTVSIVLRYFKDREEATTANTLTWTIRVD